jgi:hypothetical protein
MRKFATVLGIVWMALAGALFLWLGVSEAFGYPGLIFNGGYGEVYLVLAFGLPGYLLYRWGHASQTGSKTIA